MEIFKIDTQVLTILLFLAPGYLGFRLYLIDQPWSELNPIDIIYGSLIFSTLAFGTYGIFLYLGWRYNQFHLVETLILFSIIYAFIWRRFGHELFHKLLHRLRVTNEDNFSTSWSKIFNNPRVYLSQITVYLKDGSQVRCDDTSHFRIDDFVRIGIYPYYTDATGNIYLICTHYRSPSATRWQVVPEIHINPPWGIKLSFIRSSEITRIEARAISSGT